MYKSRHSKVCNASVLGCTYSLKLASSQALYQLNCSCPCHVYAVFWALALACACMITACRCSSTGVRVCSHCRWQCCSTTVVTRFQKGLASFERTIFRKRCQAMKHEVSAAANPSRCESIISIISIVLLTLCSTTQLPRSDAQSHCVMGP